MFTRYDWKSAEYADAFATLLNCSLEVSTRRSFIEELVRTQRSRGTAIDWGAGSGDLTAFLVGNFDHVVAVEPSIEMQKLLSRRFPGLELLAGDLATAEPRPEVDLGIMSHVLYHVPDEQWLPLTLRAASFLSDQGVLVVLLKNVESGCNRMLQHFGAPPFDLIGKLSAWAPARNDFQFLFQRLEAGVRTESLEDTLKVARFMLCDRSVDKFDRSLTEQAFHDYVRTHFWSDASNRGGWDYQLLACLIRRRTS